MVIWYERLVLQVIINIVDNAMKYTPSGGTIFISTKREDTNVHIRIADNGIGIPDDKKPYIFDMFYTANETIADGGEKSWTWTCTLQIYH